jgi:hypothetical protein
LPIPLTLYSTSACHLCELAADMLDDLPQGLTSYRELEISNDETLLERYGLTIPVVRREDTGSELSWPFDEAKLLRFLR